MTAPRWPGGVDLGDDGDVPALRQRHDPLDLRLAQVVLGDDLRVAGGLDPEGLVVGEVQAQLVVLQIPQLAYPVLDPRGGERLARDVQHEPAHRLGRLDRARRPRGPCRRRGPPAPGCGCRRRRPPRRGPLMSTRPSRTVRVYDSGFPPPPPSASRTSPARTSSLSPRTSAPAPRPSAALVGQRGVAHHHPPAALRCQPGPRAGVWERTAGIVRGASDSGYDRVGRGLAGSVAACPGSAPVPAGRPADDCRARLRLPAAPVRRGPHADARAERDRPDERGGHHRPLHVSPAAPRPGACACAGSPCQRTTVPPLIRHPSGLKLSRPGEFQVSLGHSVTTLDNLTTHLSQHPLPHHM